MQAQGIDLQMAKPEEVENFSQNFTSNILSLNVEATRQAVSFINEYKQTGICVNLF